MKTLKRMRLLMTSLLFIVSIAVSAQKVPLGMNYQAVARDYQGDELTETIIEVRFSILSGNPQGDIVYQELHSNVHTSKYGVFSIVIGAGTPISGLDDNLLDVPWENGLTYLRVEVKFDNKSGFVDMGTMQFLAVPYALYAERSLYPGPQGLQGIQGPKGDKGDPATDDQSLSFDGTNLSISGGNTINLSTLVIPHQLSVLGDTLSILGGNKVGLPNQIQDLQLDVNNILKVTKNNSATPINLSKFIDNTDSQQLTLNSTENTLAISGGNSVSLSKYIQTLTFNSNDNTLSIGNGNSIDLTPLKNDADSDPANEIQDLLLTGNELTITNKSNPSKINLGAYLDNTDNQTLTYNPSNYSLTISNGGSVSLGSLIAFRAKKTASTSASTPLSNVDFIPDEVEYNDGSNFNPITGEFSAPSTGIYSFDVKYIAPSSGDGRIIMIYKNGNPYESLGTGISSGTTLFRTLTVRLVASDRIKFVINTGTGMDIGTGTFSGSRVY